MIAKRSQTIQYWIVVHNSHGIHFQEVFAGFQNTFLRRRLWSIVKKSYGTCSRGKSNKRLVCLLISPLLIE
jgi:hypothetical protein